jgi:Ca2+-binding EF-hand superfamily protein
LAAVRLGLPIDGYLKPNTFLGKFYQKISIMNTFQIDNLIFMSVLLGKGDAKEKARYLFEEWDKNGNGDIGEAKVVKKFNQYIDLLIQHMLTLGIGHVNDRLGSFNVIDGYRKRLE